MRRLIVHCGPAKTGTSAIQARLRDAPPPGLLYPATGQWPDGAHHKLTFSIDGRTERGGIEIPPWEDMAPNLVAELDGMADGIALISSEHLNTQTLPALLDRLLPLLSKPFDDLEAVVVLRHPLERAASAFNQGVKDPVIGEARLPDVYLAKAGKGFRLLPSIRTWQNSAFKTRFLSYHPSSTLVSRFLVDLGFENQAAHPKSKRRNQSINGYGLIALLAAHRMEFDAADRARLYARLTADRVTKIWSGPSFPFSPEATQTFMDDVVRDDLIAVKDATGIDLTDLHQTPPERFSLTGRHRQALRRQFDAFDLSEAQHKRLKHMIRSFSQNDTARLDAPAHPG